jgi:hypothetical protein
VFVDGGGEERAKVLQAQHERKAAGKEAWSKFVSAKAASEWQ